METAGRAAVPTWRCGLAARYYRFRALGARSGGGAVHLAELELYGAAGARLAILAASNPGGINPPGFTADKAGARWARRASACVRWLLGGRAGGWVSE